MKYYLIAGEASGDLHGANLMKEIRRCDSQARFRFWGGDRMAAVGGAANLVTHYKDTSFFGITQVLANLRTITAQIKRCRRDFMEYGPDVLILIDYPGFNFKMAEYAHEHGLKVFYYISPKVWAWKESRVKLIRKYVDRLFIIFPFEIDYFRQRGVEPVFEGNPLVDAVEQQMAEIPSRERFFAQWGLDPARPVVALLAGSRRAEIEFNLPLMVRLAARFPARQFVVAGVSWIERKLYDRMLEGTSVRCVRDCTYPLLAHAEAAVVTSGTATLETALIGTPEVVFYRTNRFTIAAGRLLLKIPFISLVNLIMGREVVREIIQSGLGVEEAEAELRSILEGGSKRARMLSDYEVLRGKVGGSGASARFARRMVDELRGSVGGQTPDK